MAKKNMEDINIDLEELNTPVVEISKPEIKEEKEKKVKTNNTTDNKIKINCLRNERVVIRHIPKSSGMVTNPKHILYGGMAENAKRTFVVPRLSSGMFVNVLTDSEKDFLEEIMGLAPNALSIYKKVDNFWDDSLDTGISKVTLYKQDNYLNLADPEDYIKYKILLANKDFIAPSLQFLQEHPKATYQFVIISEGEEVKTAADNMNTTMKCYKEYGKIENDIDLLRIIVETIEGKPTSPQVKLEFLQTKINNLIQANSKLFLKVINDPLLSTKSLIKKCTEKGVIAKRGDFYFIKESNSPLCDYGEDPTLTVAAKYLNLPKNQELKFSLESKIK